jgi:hypothetical protein
VDESASEPARRPLSRAQTDRIAAALSAHDGPALRPPSAWPEVGPLPQVALPAAARPRPAADDALTPPASWPTAPASLPSVAPPRELPGSLPELLPPSGVLPVPSRLPSPAEPPPSPPTAFPTTPSPLPAGPPTAFPTTPSPPTPGMGSSTAAGGAEPWAAGVRALESPQPFPATPPLTGPDGGTGGLATAFRELVELLRGGLGAVPTSHGQPSPPGRPFPTPQQKPWQARDGAVGPNVGLDHAQAAPSVRVSTVPGNGNPSAASPSVPLSGG